MKTNLKKFIFGLLFLLTTVVYCEDLTIDQILAKYDENGKYETAQLSAEIITTDKLGVTKNVFTSYVNEKSDTLIVVTEGNDSGQKILRLENSVYLFYPDAEETIRLQGSALKESVMGSDFSYEDLTGENSTLKNYNGELIGIEKIDDKDCYHVKLTAKTKKQLYQITELWIDVEMFAERKSIVYSASGKALSESNISEFSLVKGKWIGTKSTMQNLLKKTSKTEMKIKSVKINEHIDPKLFSREELSW